MEAFKYGCVVGGDHFCARPDLAKRMRRYITAGQNFVIQGDRRMGKTSLVAETVAGMRGWRMIGVDFMGVKSVIDVCNRVADAMARFESEDSLFRKTLAFLAHLRPIATIDPITGVPSISVDAASARRPESVNALVDALGRQAKGRRVCIVFDEFQDVLDFKEGEQVLALMRARIQYLSDVPFVFLGSSRKDMLQLFMSPKSPFYKSAIVFDVPAIPADDFYRFVCGRFALGRRTLPRPLFDRMLDFVDHTTGDVQEICDALWQVSETRCRLDESCLERALQLVFAREVAGYGAFVKQLTDIQFRVLRALATLGGEHPLSAEFMAKARVTTPTSIKRSLTSLIQADLIYGAPGTYKFINPFFREWVRRSV